MTEGVDPDVAELSKLLEGFVAAPIDSALRDHLSKKPSWFDDERNRLLDGQLDVGAEVEALAKLMRKINGELSVAITSQDRKVDQIHSLLDALAIAQETWREERGAAYAALMQDVSTLRDAMGTVRRRQALLAPSIGLAAVAAIEIIHHFL